MRALQRRLDFTLMPGWASRALPLAAASSFSPPACTPSSISMGAGARAKRRCEFTMRQPPREAKIILFVSAGNARDMMMTRFPARDVILRAAARAGFRRRRQTMVRRLLQVEPVRIFSLSQLLSRGLKSAGFQKGMIVDASTRSLKEISRLARKIIENSWR